MAGELLGGPASVTSKVKVHRIDSVHEHSQGLQQAKAICWVNTCTRARHVESVPTAVMPMPRDLAAYP